MAYNETPTKGTIMSTKTTDTPAAVTSTTEETEREAVVESAVQRLMADLEENFITKKSFFKRAAVIAAAAGSIGLVIGLALGKSSDNDDEDEESTED
jgi:hypothetical protein